MNFDPQKTDAEHHLQEAQQDGFSQHATEALAEPDGQAESFANRKRGGRPRLALDQRKVAPVTLRFTTSERELIEAKARLAALTAPEFIRHAALGLDIPAAVPELNREAYAELANLGNNLNQVARSINSDGNVTAQLPTLVELLPRLAAAVQAIRQSLLGIHG